jgi:aminoglycoside 2''-phosphotransferase
VPAEQGWSYFTFEVEPNWIFRFPRNAEIAGALRREIAVLPDLASRLSIRVPVFERVGELDGRPFVGYRRIEGRALVATDLEGDGSLGVASVLGELHGVPLEVVAPRIAAEPTIEAWRRRYRELHASAQRRVLPLLPPTLAAALERGFARFLDSQLSTLAAVTPVHYDLGCEHLLVDTRTGRLSGIIDFEELTIGDPAVDFVGLFVECGAEAVRRVLSHYRGPRDACFEQRIGFYAWMGAYHEIEHGLEHADRSHIDAGITGLEQRLQDG